MQALLALGTDVAKRDWLNRTPARTARACGSEDLVGLIKEHSTSQSVAHQQCLHDLLKLLDLTAQESISARQKCAINANDYSVKDSYLVHCAAITIRQVTQIYTLIALTSPNNIQ